MAQLTEVIAPITQDLRADDLRFDIIKGLEKLNMMDGALDNAALTIDSGDWVVKTATGFDKPATGNAVAHVFPVITGNTSYDAQATGALTVVVNGGFLYKTTKYVAGSYSVGQNLCVKDLGAGEKVPSAAGANDAIVARVWAIDAVKGIMTILVLNR